MYGLWFNLLGLNSSPRTIRNPNTTSTSKSLYIYRVLNVLKEQNELINKIECFEQQACWSCIFFLFLSCLYFLFFSFSFSLFFIFSSFFLGLPFTGTVHTTPKQLQLLSNSSSFLTLNPPQLNVDKSLTCPTLDRAIVIYKRRAIVFLYDKT